MLTRKLECLRGTSPQEKQAKSFCQMIWKGKEATKSQRFAVTIETKLVILER